MREFYTNLVGMSCDHIAEPNPTYDYTIVAVWLNDRGILTCAIVHDEGGRPSTMFATDLLMMPRDYVAPEEH